jgi:hypothetical protein
MSRHEWAAAAAVFAVLTACWPIAALAGEHIYAYEADSPATRVLAPTGLSFVFEKGPLGSVRVERIIQTGEQGEAELKPAPESQLGEGGLAAALAGARPAGGLYEIEPEGDGRAFVGAVCPGADRAWLVISPVERFRDLEVQAVGKTSGAPARHCVDLAFVFHSELKLPPGRPPPRPRFPIAP